MAQRSKVGQLWRFLQYCNCLFVLEQNKQVMGWKVMVTKAKKQLLLFLKGINTLVLANHASAAYAINFKCLTAVVLNRLFLLVPWRIKITLEIWTSSNISTISCTLHIIVFLCRNVWVYTETYDLLGLEDGAWLPGQRGFKRLYSHNFNNRVVSIDAGDVVRKLPTYTNKQIVLQDY